MIYHNKSLISLGDTNYSFFRHGWETCDLVNADHIIDLRNEKLPFNDESIDAFYSSHMIEHLEYESCKKLFQEIYRCLRKEGFFRVVTPNMDLLLERYYAEDWEFFLRADGQFILDQIINNKITPDSLLIHNRFVGWFASYSGRLDTGGGPIVDKKIVDKKLNELTKYEFRDWCVSLLEKERIYAHLHIYDYSELESMLKEEGFCNIEMKSYQCSSCNDMQYPIPIDNPKHQIYSLYIECNK